MPGSSGTFYKLEPDSRMGLRKNYALIYWALVKIQTLCFY